MSGVANNNKRTLKAKGKESKTMSKPLEELEHQDDSDNILDESGMIRISLNKLSSIEFDIFTDNEEKKNTKKRKTKTSSRKLWS